MQAATANVSYAARIGFKRRNADQRYADHGMVTIKWNTKYMQASEVPVSVPGIRPTRLGFAGLKFRRVRFQILRLQLWCYLRR
ncbi:hypothetical protein KCP69_18275 [Salmonella enterica subsp. enterica]|nr:hypothetical protein KCP69_18275 [Salmonella enterica subsp. enterica]